MDYYSLMKLNRLAQAQATTESEMKIYDLTVLGWSFAIKLSAFDLMTSSTTPSRTWSQ